MKWRCLDRTIDLARRGEVMGIVNATPDSFSDGGLFATVEAAVAHGRALVAEGAALVDIGGESTRPGAGPVDEAEERRRVLPVVSRLAAECPEAILSIDTCKPAVAIAALAAGARVVNDVRGFRDPAMVEAAATSGAGLVVMHMRGEPRTMQQSPAYDDLHAEIVGFFRDRYEALLAAGAAPEQIVFDPGIGFGKTLGHNLAILRELQRYTVEGRPILLGVSRKSFLGKLVGSERIEERSWATVAVTAYARERGVRLHRVHEAKPNLEALRMAEAMLPL
jgi:dihydropteroate synthase